MYTDDTTVQIGLPLSIEKKIPTPPHKYVHPINYSAGG